MAAIPLTIEDLKKHLGPGLGLRKSKYMIEIPVPGKEKGKTLNILCRSTAFPERNIGTVTVYDKGRKYNVRAETDFPGTYNISIVDDSEMSLRWLFDGWLNLVDDTLPTGSFVNASEKTPNASYEVSPTFNLGQFGEGGKTKYQADVNVWQLGPTGEKVYGYKLQNAFPSSVGIVELADSDQFTLSEFSVTFTYSEMIPMKPIKVSIPSTSSTSGTSNTSSTSSTSSTSNSYINSSNKSASPINATTSKDLEENIKNKDDSNTNTPNNNITKNIVIPSSIAEIKIAAQTLNNLVQIK